MAQLISAHSTDVPPVPHQWFIADASTPFDTVVMIGYDHYPEQIEFLISAAEEAAKEGKNTLILGNGESNIPTNYTGLLQGKINGRTQVVLFGHGNESDNYHSIDLVEGQEDIAHTVQDIVSISGENPPHRVFVFSCYAEAAKANFLRTHSPVQVILDGSHNPTLIGLNLKAICTLISGEYLPHLPPEGGVNQRALYDHVTIIENGKVATHVPLTLSGLINSGTPQLAAPEILRNRLLLATDHGDTTKVKQLLALGINPNQAKNLLELTPLHLTAEKNHLSTAEALLAQGADPNLPDREGFTPLHFAAHYGHLEMVEKLLAYEANPNAQDKNEETPLHLATRQGHTHVAEALLKHRANPNFPNNNKATPLHFAAYYGHLIIMEKLFHYKANPNAQNKEGITPIYLTAQQGHADATRILLSHGAEPNIPNNEEATPLNIAAERGRTAVTQVLLDHRTDPNLPDRKGNSPLHFAAFYGNPEIVEKLIAHGANPNVQNKEGVTPLYVAVEKGYTAVVEVLLKHSTKPNIPNNQKVTPLQIAIEKGQTAITQLLLDHGADPNLPNIKANTPLHFAICRGNPETVEKLIAHGANPHALNDQGYTPKDYLEFVEDPEKKAAIERILEQAETIRNRKICTAAAEGRIDIVTALLHCGVSPKAEDKNGDTTLHLAAAEGHPAVVEVLLEHGANPNTKTQSGGNTALHLAIIEEHPTVVEILLERSADPHVLNKKGLTPKDYLKFVEDPEKKAAIERILEQAERKSQEELSVLPTLDSVDVGNIACKESRRKQNSVSG